MSAGPRSRVLVVSGAAIFVASSLFPIAAGLLREPAPRWMGILDVALAFLLACVGFAITAKRPAGKAEDAAVSLAVLRGGTNVFLLLLVVFLLAAKSIHWDILLVGLGWRAWLFASVLPSAVSLWRSR